MTGDGIIEIVHDALENSKSSFTKYDPSKVKYCNSENTYPIVTTNKWQSAKKQKEAKNVIN